MSCKRCGTDMTNLDYCVTCREGVELKAAVSKFLDVLDEQSFFIAETGEERVRVEIDRESRLNTARAVLDKALGMKPWDARKTGNGDWRVARKMFDPEGRTFERGSWAGGVSTEMLARNEAARRNGEPLPFPIEVPMTDDRLKLWAHLVSAHAGIYGLDQTYEQLTEEHEHEHTGPGTIRSHPRESRKASLKKIGQVLIECDDDDRGQD